MYYCEAPRASSAPKRLETRLLRIGVMCAWILTEVINANAQRLGTPPEAVDRCGHRRRSDGGPYSRLGGNSLSRPRPPLACCSRAGIRRGAAGCRRPPLRVRTLGPTLARTTHDHRRPHD